MTEELGTGTADPPPHAVGRATVGLVGRAATVPIGHLIEGDAVVPTPQGATRRASLRLPAFWLLVALLVVGTFRMAALVSTAFAHFPIAGLTAALLFAVYAIPFVLVVRSVDFFEPEPKLLVAAAGRPAAL